ncbi:hypothetical protein [Silanimonas sp.]|jgi:hypothetical protein
MPWPLLAFTALILVAWIATLMWLARGFRRGWLMEEDASAMPPRRDLRL